MRREHRRGIARRFGVDEDERELLGRILWGLLIFILAKEVADEIDVGGGLLGSLVLFGLVVAFGVLWVLAARAIGRIRGKPAARPPS